ncbi:MAG: DUF6049 family protein [Propionicimonas sp.]|uniref:hypothetical protein n=1 Tax=Propionicimonas sp. TaxID=1955623 RepID=UPI003D10FDAE
MIDGTGGTHRALALVLAWVTAVAGLLLWLPAADARAADQPLVSFTMTSLDVSGYGSDDTVTLEGTVTNTGSVNAYGVQVILWRSRDEIQSLATLRQASSNTILGSRLPISADHYVVVTTSAEAFTPGQTAQVTLRATIGELGFDTRGAAFAFGADVIANAEPTGEYRTVGQLRTFVAIPTKAKVPVTSIVLLSAAPTKLVDNLFRNDDLASELVGRLSTLLDAAAEPGMSWLIDPALLDEVRDMADGYQVKKGDGTVAGTGASAAEEWLDRFDALDRDAGARTLFANPDLEGARAAGDDLAVSRSERAAATVSGLDDLPVVAVPNGLLLTSATLASLTDSSVDLALADNTTTAGALQGGDGDEPAVLAVSAAFPGDGALAENLRRQYALAATVIAGERGEARLLTTAAEVAADEADSPSWTVRRDLGELLDSDPSHRTANLQAVKPAHLTSQQFAAISRLESDFTAYAELARSSTLPEQSDAAVSRAIATAWVDDSRGFDEQLAGMNDLVGVPALGRAVVLDASARFVMSSRANQFPITVTNNLTEEITLRIVVASNNPQRLSVPDSDPVTVEPGQSVTVNIRPEATSNGVVTARAYAATESGRRITPDTSIIIEVTDLGVVAWVIVTVSALVLIGATAWRIRQVRRREATAAPAEPSPTEPTPADEP